MNMYRMMYVAKRLLLFRDLCFVAPFLQIQTRLRMPTTYGDAIETKMCFLGLCCGHHCARHPWCEAHTSLHRKT